MESNTPAIDATAQRAAPKDNWPLGACAFVVVVILISIGLAMSVGQLKHLERQLQAINSANESSK